MKNNSLRYLRCGIIISALFLFPVVSNASTIFVNPSAAGANNGTSWADAFTSLTDALSVANPGDEIWVVQGVYKPVTLVDLNSSGGIDPREAVFEIPPSVKVYGGFTGTEAELNDRDWEANITILSGDIDNNDINLDGNFIAEDVDDIVGNNSYHVVYTNNVSINTHIDGFVITGGSANIAVPVDAFDPNLDGGGWYNRLSGGWNASSPSVINSIFSGNFASSEGGAMYNVGTLDGEILSIIRNTTFSKNKAGVAGGAIFLGSFSTGTYEPQIIKSKFIMNEAFRRGGAISLIGDHAKIDSSEFLNNSVTAISLDFSTLPGSGGAVNMTASNAVFKNCIFDNNKATGNPTGPFEGGGGGAVYMSVNEPQTSGLGASEPKFISCGFYNNIASDNTAAWGGAAAHLSDAGILKPQYINCVFNNNQAQNDGGAIANFTRVISEPAGFTPVLEPLITNCTFTDNHAGQRGGAFYSDGFLFMGSEILKSKIENSILWNNSADTDGSEVYNTGNNLVTYSLIEGSGGSGGGWNASIGTDGGNNIDVDPLFVNEALPSGADANPATIDDGLRLTNASPAMNTGNNAASGLAGITKDYIGNNRIIESTVDMGAYESCETVNQPPVAAAKDFIIAADENCAADVSPELIDDGSSDPDGDNLIFTISPVGPYPLGQTEVFLIVSDGFLKDSMVATITVTDSSAPQIITENSSMKLWPPNHKYYEININSIVTSVQDNCESLSIEEIYIKSVGSDEPENAAGGNDGNTVNDIVISSDSKSVSLRQERNGSGNGRVYTINLEVQDSQGNISSYQYFVEVPISNNGSGAVNDGPLYFVNSNSGILVSAGDTREKLNQIIPEDFSLAQNFPNPFNPSTIISFGIPQDGHIKLNVYNLLGEVAAELINGFEEAGIHNVEFNAHNLNSGIYIYKLEAGEKIFTRKMILVK